MLQTPVLLIAFNRPDITQKVFDQIRDAKPQRFFLAVDGPRPNHPDDVLKCAKTQAIVHQVDWDCDVKTFFRDQNRGCGYGPAEAISWFFEHVEYGIILEDDCLPDSSFFPYCESILTKYKDDHRIAIVSGTNPILKWKDKRKSYHFTVLPGTWGWATWRRAWEKFDYNAAAWHLPDGRERVRRTLQNDRYFNHFANEFDHYFKEIRADVWDFQWYFCCLFHGSYGIIPARNLISNVGFGQLATHTLKESDAKARLPTFGLELPLRDHPFRIDRFFDRYLFERTINPRKRSFQKKVVLKLIKILQRKGFF